MVSIQIICDRDDPLANYVVKADSMTGYATTCRMQTLHFLRQVLLNPGTLAWVVETDSHDKPLKAVSDDPSSPSQTPESTTGGGQVIGWAIWTRHGTSPVAQNWKRANSSLSTQLEALLHSLTTWSINHLSNPIIDRNHTAAVSHIMRSDFDRAIFAEAWQLEGCYVDPRWRRRGAGTLALEWGMAQARAERVPVVMKASPSGVAFYEKAAGEAGPGTWGGFRRLRREAFDAFFETGGEGYWQMVWEPEGGKERWFERALETAEPKQRPP